MPNKNTWHKVTAKDQQRIECGQIGCESPATECEHVRFTRNGGSAGLAFYYYCPKHTLEEQQRQEGLSK